MDETSHISPLRRWLESILVWYILFMIVYLFARFILQTEWRFIALVNNAVPYLFFPVIVGLAIAALLKSRRLTGLYFLVALIGALWIIPPLIPAQFNASETDSGIDIITFNLYPYNEEFDAVTDWILAHSPDILALQELPADQSLVADIEASYEYGISQAYETGHAFYSNYPIVESGDIQVNETIMQRVVVDIEGTQVVFYNVHLFMPFNDREADWLVLRYDESRRNAQIEVLLELIQAETLPVIVTGDFNMTEWSPMYHQIASVLDDAYRQTSWGIGATWPAGESEDTSDGYPRLLRLDYVWYSEPIEANYAIVGSAPGSDHFPLRVELNIP